MSQKSGTPRMSSERIVKDIRRATRKQYSAEEKIRIVLNGLRGEHSIAELCRREGIPRHFLPLVRSLPDRRPGVGIHFGVRISKFAPKKPSNWFCLKLCCGLDCKGVKL